MTQTVSQPRRFEPSRLPRRNRRDARRDRHPQAARPEAGLRCARGLPHRPGARRPGADRLVARGPRRRHDHGLHRQGRARHGSHDDDDAARGRRARCRAFRDQRHRGRHVAVRRPGLHRRQPVEQDGVRTHGSDPPGRRRGPSRAPDDGVEAAQRAGVAARGQGGRCRGQGQQRPDGVVRAADRRQAVQPQDHRQGRAEDVRPVQDRRHVRAPAGCRRQGDRRIRLHAGRAHPGPRARARRAAADARLDARRRRRLEGQEATRRDQGRRQEELRRGRRERGVAGDRRGGRAEGQVERRAASELRHVLRRPADDVADDQPCPDRHARRRRGARRRRRRRSRRPTTIRSRCTARWAPRPEWLRSRERPRPSGRRRRACTRFAVRSRRRSASPRRTSTCSTSRARAATA